MTRGLKECGIYLGPGKNDRWLSQQRTHKFEYIFSFWWTNQEPKGTVQWSFFFHNKFALGEYIHVHLVISKVWFMRGFIYKCWNTNYLTLITWSYSVKIHVTPYTKRYLCWYIKLVVLFFFFCKFGIGKNLAQLIDI